MQNILQTLGQPQFMVVFSAFLSAVLIDLKAYVDYDDEGSGKKFSWKKAITRWVIGIITGLLTSLGMVAAPDIVAFFTNL